MSAAQNIGRVIAQRCCEAGITAMILEAPEHGDKSDKVGGRTSPCITVYFYTQSSLL